MNRPCTRGPIAVAETILVFEAQAMGMIGVIRSLGRAKFNVHAASARADALGLASRYASVSVQHPAYESPDFIRWLDDYLIQHTITAIVPSEAFLLAIEAHYERYRLLLPDAPERASLYRSFAKTDVQRCFADAADSSLRAHMPRALVAKRGGAPVGELAEWNWPLYVKTDALYADHDRAAGVKAAHNSTELRHQLERALQTHRCVLVQESVPGVKATVNLWRHRGEFRATSMCVAMHENPHTGGLTAYRQIWWNDAMLEDAKRRLEALDWHGVAMVEYKWDAASGQFWFLELNARYWNALNLDLLAGKDFPRWQLDAFFGHATVLDMTPGPVGFRARNTVPADIGYVMSRCRDARVSWWRKLATVVEFVWLGLHPAVHSDLWFPGDRRLYWRAWWQFLSRLGRAA